MRNADNKTYKLIMKSKNTFLHTFICNLAIFNSLFQLFIDNPLLIDGHAFDLGVYVLITSINPLLIYRWTREVRVRICTEPYHPFDPENVEKYVPKDNHRHLKEMPSLKTATSLNFSALEAFDYYLKRQNHDAKMVWEQIDDAIVSITLSKLPFIMDSVDDFKGDSMINLFELVRFDFIVDDRMKVYLMELETTLKSIPEPEISHGHSEMLEQLFYNTISMLGLSNNEFKLLR